MKSDFECHITMKGDRSSLETLVARLRGNWTFSCIDGDPVLGAHVFCYATNHFGSELEAKMRTNDATGELICAGVNPIRAKIEHVVWDLRF